jgi:hypothetical protein
MESMNKAHKLTFYGVQLFTEASRSIMKIQIQSSYYGSDTVCIYRDT